jgi:hypothetical protein
MYKVNSNDMWYQNDPFLASFFPSQRVLVVSDSEMAELRKAEAERQVALIDSRINRYETALEELKEERELVNKSAGLLSAEIDA